MIRVPSSRARAGFTLIELLVVIAIIALLVGLLVAGVMRVMAKGPDLLEVQDIQDLGKALDQFKMDKKTYPPDVIILRAKYASYFSGGAPASLLDADSLYYLSRIWPNMGNWDLNYPNGINWSTLNDPTNAGGFTNVTLQGPQALVYFLAGPQQLGFTSNPKNPTVAVANPETKKWFEFKTGRLIPIGAAFPAYASNHNTGMPFLYFSSGKDGYNKLAGTLTTGANGTIAAHAVTIVNFQGGTDVVGPYFQIANGKQKYWNPTTYQIISAGADGCFDTLNSPTMGYPSEYDDAAAPGATTYLWKDNRSNFSTLQLGANVQ